MTDAQGVPLAATVTAADVPEITQVFTTLDDMHPWRRAGAEAAEDRPLAGGSGLQLGTGAAGFEAEGDHARCWRPAIRSTAAVWASPAGT